MPGYSLRVSGQAVIYEAAVVLGGSQAAEHTWVQPVLLFQAQDVPAKRQYLNYCWAGGCLRSQRQLSEPFADSWVGCGSASSRFHHPVAYPFLIQN